MALRAVPEHPKFAQLKTRLGVGKAVALGYLECIWHFAGRFTPQGDIGKYEDAAIEAWVEWDGEAGALIQALVDTRWLDWDDTYRILVHDWAQHADKATKQALGRSKLGFCVPSVHTPGAHVFQPYSPPVPVPEPVPVPVPEPDSALRAVPSKNQTAIEREFEEDWPKFWSTGAKGTARKAYVKARAKVSREKLMEAVIRLGPLVKAHAASNGYTPPLPASWLNGERWEDGEDVYAITRPRGKPASNGSLDLSFLRKVAGVEDE
jgi:hypothetical protein